MVHRSRSPVPGLNATLPGRLCAVLTAMLLAMPAVAFQLDADGEGSAFRARLPDAAYRASGDANLADASVRDADGRPIRFALCALAGTRDADSTLETHPVYDGSRLTIASDGSLRRVFASGFKLDDKVRPKAQVIDARGIDGTVLKLELGYDAAIAFDWRAIRVRSSANLQIWTKLEATVTRRADDRLEVDLSPMRADFFELSVPDGTPATAVRASYRLDAPARVIHWFTPRAGDGPGEFVSDRPVGLVALRLRAASPQPSGPLVLESRQQASQAWRPRWSAEAPLDEQALVANFSRETDRLWRLRAPHLAQLPALELGHQAMELRVSADGPGPWRLSFDGSAPPISCEAPLWKSARAGTLSISDDESAQAAAADARGGGNIRGPILIIVLALFTGLGIWRWLSIRRARR